MATNGTESGDEDEQDDIENGDLEMSVSAERREQRRREVQALVTSNRSVYTLKELKRIKKLFFVEKEHIEVGYRAHENMTAKMCCRSVCQVHNETFNIWSHMLPAVYIIYQLVLLCLGSGCYSEFKTTQSFVV